MNFLKSRLLVLMKLRFILKKIKAMLRLEDLLNNIIETLKKTYLILKIKKLIYISNNSNLKTCLIKCHLFISFQDFKVRTITTPKPQINNYKVLPLTKQTFFTNTHWNMLEISLCTWKSIWRKKGTSFTEIKNQIWLEFHRK